MRKYLLAATAAAAMASSPAAARDNSWYAGIEGGVMLVEDLDLDYEDEFVAVDDAISIDHSMGIDADIIGGYDFGAFRAEAELGYKRAGIDEITVSGQLGAPTTGVVEADGSARAISAMFNLLLDFGDDDGVSGYLGGGLGLARVRYSLDAAPGEVDFRDTDDALAW